jgi:hypothetical protein
MRTGVKRAAQIVGVGAGTAALVAVAYAGTSWLRYGKTSRSEPRDPLLDRFMPSYEVREVHRTRVDAPPELTYTVAESLDFQESALMVGIFKGRELLMGATPQRRQGQSFLSEVRSLGWRVLDERPGQRLVMGAVTQPWKADVQFRGLEPEEFAAFNEPGYAKIVWMIAAEPDGVAGSVFRTETRVMTTDADSRRRFRRYWTMVSPGVVLIRHEMLRLVRREAERRQRHSLQGTMLIDRYLPRFDVTEVHEVQVNAPSDLTYAAIREADLRDPLVGALFAVRELPNRIARKLRGEPPPPAAKSFTFKNVATEDMGWMSLDEKPGDEFVVGSVGRFWQGDYGWRPVAREAFVGFNEPGYAKLAVSFCVRPNPSGGTVLRYEARTATTDKAARVHFRRYWRMIRPGVAMVMRRALTRIKAEAEGRPTAVGAVT